jgi:hypothetical protein
MLFLVSNVCHRMSDIICGAIGGVPVASYGAGQRFTTVVEFDGGWIAVEGDPLEVRAAIQWARGLGLPMVALTGPGGEPIWFGLNVAWSVGVMDRAGS